MLLLYTPVSDHRLVTNLLFVSAILFAAGWYCGFLAHRLWAAATRHMPEQDWEQTLPLRGRWLRYPGVLALALIAGVCFLVAGTCGFVALATVFRLV